MNSSWRIFSLCDKVINIAIPRHSDDVPVVLDKRQVKMTLLTTFESVSTQSNAISFACLTLKTEKLKQAYLETPLGLGTLLRAPGQ